MKLKLRCLRRGDVVKVKRLRDLAGSYPEMERVIKRIHDEGATILEEATGRQSSNPSEMAAMVLDVAKAMKKGPPRHVSQRNGGKGGKPRKQTEMSDKDARAIWRDTVYYSTNDDALAAMPGWTRDMAYSRFGGSGRPKFRKQ